MKQFAAAAAATTAAVFFVLTATAATVANDADPEGLGDKKEKKDHPGSLPNIDLDSFYYETALSPTEATLLASTLDGRLIAIDELSGDILWQLDDEPVVKSPYDSTKPVLPAFLPDPKDGSIYMIGGGLKDPLKKLPFTIPELVAASPCKSSDGILYTGKKVDTWFSVDRYTGFRQGAISFSGCVAGLRDQCPSLEPTNILIGRTEYNIMMFDSRADGRRWNISFFDYSSNLAGADLGRDYEFAHFTDSSSGSLVTLDRRTGAIEWERHLGSPVVALYGMEGEGIVNVPFTSVSKETLNNLLEQFNMPESKEIIGETKLYPTLYVGEHDQGLYAMPSLVDEETLTIAPSTTGPLLLEGPQNFEVPSEINLDIIGGSGDARGDPLGIPLGRESENKDKSSVLLFGYYQVPEHSTIKLSPAMTHLQLTSTSNHAPPRHKGYMYANGAGGARTMRGSGGGRSYYSNHQPQQRHSTLMVPSFRAPPILSEDTEDYASYFEEFTGGENTSSGRMNGPPVPPSYDGDLVQAGFQQLKQLNTTFIVSYDMIRFCLELLPLAKDSLMAVENKEQKAIVCLLMIVTILLYRILSSYSLRLIDPDSSLSSNPNSSSSYWRRTNSSSSTLDGSVTASPVELDDGTLRVGNIVLDPKEILGKGCEGTFVYKGRFDNRSVAVKRVLNACFSVADREVDLLRESDEHPNVVRYFCMEQDRQFRYIALELCAATLQDVVEGRCPQEGLDPITLLRQATLGLKHLHHLEIVHRDIKPQNVLISQPGRRGDVRAMISDFGLCKKLKVGRMSFSRRSGVAGTDGWIAPEMMQGEGSNTCAVDIFSLGCVYHYVLTGGHHPFGESFRRQANIVTGIYNLDRMSDSPTALSLVENMVQFEQRLRPTAQAILRHPMFWSKEKVLSFLQDVSDRVDKEDPDSALVIGLERGRQDILRGSNWHDLLDETVREDLRKHRSYNGKSLRDLLRAMRNKKHHYNELPEETKALYGKLPDQFVDYWTSRFPKLLIHSWHWMHCKKNEPNFVKYFDKDFDFLPSHQRASSPTLIPESIRDRLGIHRPEQALFDPPFAVTGGHNKEQFYPLTKDEDDENSVVSRWEDIDSQRLRKTFQEVNKKDEILDNHSEKASASTSPSPTTASATVTTEDEEEIFHEMPGSTDQEVATKSKGTKRRVVVQLESQARQRELEAHRPTWSEALQNITADHKLAAEKNRENKENFDPFVVAEEETIVVAEKEAVVVADSAEASKGPVWVLPPETEPSKRKANKNKKKKKVNKV